MAKEEKGFFDWLIDDICNTIEIKGAVEASRDENGRVDKWAALGGAMGLGHTSDDEIATLAGILGAEGAFDDECDDSDSDYDLLSEDSYPTPETTFDQYNDEIMKDFDRLLSLGNDPEEFEDTLIGSNLIFADDMKLLSDAGYDELDLELMEPEELKEAMESAGVDTIFYDFD